MQNHPQPETQERGQRPLIRRRTELEAKLLAWRSGWIRLDELRIRKLEKELEAVLAGLPDQDPLAQALIRRAPGPGG